MAKKVVWTSRTKLACACLENPTVVICLTSADLLAPVACPDDSTEPDMPYAFTTIEATLTKSWKSQGVCETPNWSYVFEYDETLLADPTVALTTEQISGVFCKGCLTTWVEEKIGNEIQVLLDPGAGTVTIVTQHGCRIPFPVNF